MIEKILLKSPEKAIALARRPLPGHLRRQTRTITPKQEACPGCGGTLKHLGEDVSGILGDVPAGFKVIRQVRTKPCCTGCGRIVEAPAPSRAIDRALAGPGCWLTCWSRSIPILCRSAGRRKSASARASNRSARPWPDG